MARIRQFTKFYKGGMEEIIESHNSQITMQNNVGHKVVATSLCAMNPDTYIFAVTYEYVEENGGN